MEKQKQQVIPYVGALPVTTWNAATSFTSKPIEFSGSTRWSLDIQGWAGVTASAPKVTILHSNLEDGEYKAYSTLATSVDLTVAGNRIIIDSIFPSRYMKIQYVSGGSTGTLSMVLSK